MLAFGQYCLTLRINRSPSLHSTEHVEEKTQISIHFSDWFISQFMHRNVMLTYLNVTNSKTQFSPHHNPAETKHRRHDWEWFCEQLRINGHHIARCLTVQQAARASASGPVCLDCVNNAPCYGCGHCVPLDAQSSLLSPLTVQSASKVICGTFYLCALSVSPAWFIASVCRVQCTYVERKCFLFLIGTEASLNSLK